MNVQKNYPVTGAGLGMRREVIDDFNTSHAEGIDFMEVAPENWIPIGGKMERQFRHLTERFPFLIHGLSLSIGSPSPLDEELVKSIKIFMKEYNIAYYSEHLSYCSDDGHLYDLLPIPFTEEAVYYTANRIKRVQDILEQRIAMENASYYVDVGQELTELEFLKAVIEEADCDMLLDVNNIYVNSVNHRYDAKAFLKALPGERIAYGHIAGHYDEAEDLIVDTHGADVIDPVWELLDVAYESFGVFPTLVERDFNIPPLEVLIKEVEHVQAIQAKYQTKQTSAVA